MRLYGADPARIEIVPPGVDHAFFSPGDRGRRPLGPPPPRPRRRAGAAVRRAHPAAQGRSTSPSGPWPSWVDPTATLVVVGGASGADGDAEVDRVHKLVGRARRGRPGALRRPRARTTCCPPTTGPPTSCLVPEPLRVVRPGRPRGGGVRHPGRGRRGRRPAHARRPRAHRLPRRGPRPGRVRRRTPSEVLDRPRAGRRAVGPGAPAGRRGYTWSTAAGRLRRLYADLTARALVDCQLSPRRR